MTNEPPDGIQHGLAYAGRPVFPFTAIVGQDRMKRALVLNTINPRIGGVLIRGEKGTAKSTAVRALANLLPQIEAMPNCPYACDPATPAAWCDRCQQLHGSAESRGGSTSHPSDYAAAGTLSSGQRDSAPSPGHRRVPLVELPVGATEDRVVGTLDLERAIKQGERHFEPGLLAAANRGILYVDEVNLLNDHLVDILLDAAAMGVNYVEREGVSVQHPSDFILVGTMNPEEGDLRPQLLDRFALAVEVEGLPDPAQRAEVVRRRIAFEADHRAFATGWEAGEAAERQRILAARALLPSVRLDDRMLGLITQLCCDFEVDGLRADIVIYKTAITLAAYAGRRRVTEGDVRDAAELALLHRQRRQPFEQPELDRQRLDERIRDFLDHQTSSDATSDDDEDPGDAPAPSVAGDGLGQGEGEPQQRVFAPGRPPTPPPMAAPPPVRLRTAGRGRRSKALVYPWQAQAGDAGPYVRSVAPREPAVRAWAFDATLRAAAPHQRTRGAQLACTDSAAPAPMAVHLERRDVRQKVREARLSNLILFVVDASGSMAARDRMTAAKGAVLSLLLDAYRKRDQVGLIAFRGRGAEVLLPPTRSVELAESQLRVLPTGGRTPLAHGLAMAADMLARHRLLQPGILPLLVLVSDGRANVPLAASQSPPQGARGRATCTPRDLPLPGGSWGARLRADTDLLGEVRDLGVRLQRAQVASVVIDSESGALQLGMAREVATLLGARYLAIGELDAARLAGAVREARA